jgi:GNAT superfamily N-acetyltransferase
MSKSVSYTIRNAQPSEFEALGKLMVRVYSQLEGFPKANEQPAYYKMLENIGELTKKPETELLVAVSPTGTLAGGVVYFSDMQYYGSGGTATLEKNASGFRLLAVDPSVRGEGVGKLLIDACIHRAKARGHQCVVIHTTQAMLVAWGMYERIGFVRAQDLDFKQGELPVYGFRLKLKY